MGKKKESATAKPKGSQHSSKPATKDVRAETTTPPVRVDEATKKQQQLILDIFRNTFSDVLTSSDFTSTLQSVKAALFDRDFARAFADDRNLSVYAARWSPTRALCYASVFGSIQDHLRAICISQPSADSESPSLGVLSIGGGAAETAALAIFLGSSSSSPPPTGSITLLDSAPWDAVVSSLHKSLTSPPPLSKYASEAARAANTPVINPDRFAAEFVQGDVLTLTTPDLSTAIGHKPALVTLFFTLNELFTSAGIGPTTKFLLNLTSIIPAGSLLLVVDSPGSYAETALGKDSKKKYPMQWLLDRILLRDNDEPVAGGRRWAKLESHDSLWFRLADGLEYPIPLENMRYQMHLYQAEVVATGAN
ncbi:hypothetical protein QBC47DRAFT_218597 [Echria macrotheca]|uniref:25S rRNA (Uridine(2843)-N(3))-methyltransferase n=1 Tax=Echria macrotheca TaxID=438768 RepID=A0AAJ0BA28_9PEZI|nr:hypothetical protein QBC47DRAFT_218597 [Echria macrotheca]